MRRSQKKTQSRTQANQTEDKCDKVAEDKRADSLSSKTTIQETDEGRLLPDLSPGSLKTTKMTNILTKD